MKTEFIKTKIHHQGLLVNNDRDVYEDVFIRLP